MEETTPQSSPEVQVLKTATCASTSGRSKLTYQVGWTPDSEMHVRITANTSSGAISKNWVAFRAIREVLASVRAGELTSGHMQQLCAGQSVNNAGFLLAVLLSEGLVRPSTSKRRAYECADDAAFDAAINAWKSAADGDGEKAPRSAVESRVMVLRKSSRNTPSRPLHRRQRKAVAVRQHRWSASRRSPRRSRRRGRRRNPHRARRVGSGQAELSGLVRWSSFPVVGRGLARASPRNANKVLDDPRTHAQCRPYTDPPERRCRSTLSGERLYK